MEKTLILSSGRCSWGKCYACGWGKLEADVDVARLKKLIEKTELGGVERLKVFASGSFLDQAQFPADFRQWFAGHVRGRGIKELVVESRPEFVTQEALEPFKGMRLTVAIGLESAVPEVLKAYNKGFTPDDFAKAAELLHKNGFGVRTYVMVNIPFSKDVQKDLDKSVEFALRHSDSIVLINTFPHSKAALFNLWVSGKWKPYDKRQFEDAVAKWRGNLKIEIDFQNYLFIPKFSDKPGIIGATRENLEHPYYNVWQDYFARFYEPPAGKDIVLFLPCSFKKPYTSSETHRAIDAVLRKSQLYPRIHKVVLSNPGVIPIEFCHYYPFVAYDWPEAQETPELMKAYVEVNKERVKQYLSHHKYKEYFCFLKYSETYEALRQACDELGIKLTNLLAPDTYKAVKDQKNPIITKEALADLEKGLK
jgi:hypothetical protein